MNDMLKHLEIIFVAGMFSNSDWEHKIKMMIMVFYTEILKNGIQVYHIPDVLIKDAFPVFQILALETENQRFCWYFYPENKLGFRLLVEKGRKWIFKELVCAKYLLFFLSSQ